MPENTRGERTQGASGWLFQAAVIGALIAISYATHEVAALKQFDAALRQHGRPFVPVAAGLAILGFVLLMGTLMAPILAAGGAKEPTEEDLEQLGEVRPMTHEEVEQMSARRIRNWKPGWSTYRITGETAGVEMGDAFSFREMKDALRTGAALQSPRWRRRLTMFVGVLLMLYGGFGAFALHGPLYIAALCGGALLYATVRLGWAFWKA